MARTTQRIRFKVEDIWQGLEWATPAGSMRFDEQDDGSWDLTWWDRENNTWQWIKNGTDVEVCRKANEMIRGAD